MYEHSLENNLPYNLPPPLLLCCNAPVWWYEGFYWLWLVLRLAMHEWMNKISYTLYRQPIINPRPRLCATHIIMPNGSDTTTQRRFPISIRFSVFLYFSVSSNFISMHLPLPSFLVHPPAQVHIIFAPSIFGSMYVCARVYQSDQSIWHKHTDLFFSRSHSFSLFGLLAARFSPLFEEIEQRI